MSVLQGFLLTDRTAIVTGGEGLIGKVICDTIEELGGNAYSIDINGSADETCNITDPQQVKKLSERYSEADIIVNCAVGHQKPQVDIGEGYVDDINIGLVGSLNMIACFGPLMATRGKGVILNIGSDLSLIAPDPRLYPIGTGKPVAYSVVKHGIVGMTRYFAAVWGVAGVRCNCLCPGGIDQGQTKPYVPLNRLMKLEEIKGPVAFLLSDASSYMTGATLVVDGGRTCW